MMLLLDTHVLLWWLGNDSTLSTEARNAIADPDNAVYVSAASAWEIAIKEHIGKLQAPTDLEAQLYAHDFEPLPISVAHALTAGALPRYHDDPFDRMLVAQTIEERLTLVTRDPRMAPYEVPLLRT